MTEKDEVMKKKKPAAKKKTKSKKKAKKKMSLNRRTVRLYQLFGHPAQLVSKSDGTVVAEGDAAWAEHRKIFKLRISNKSE